jgi:hypothetical protein
MEVCVDVQTGALWRIASTRLQRTGEIVVELAVNRLAWSSRLSPAQSRLSTALMVNCMSIREAIAMTRLRLVTLLNRWLSPDPPPFYGWPDDSE